MDRQIGRIHQRSVLSEGLGPAAGSPGVQIGFSLCQSTFQFGAAEPLVPEKHPDHPGSFAVESFLKSGRHHRLGLRPGVQAREKPHHQNKTQGGQKKGFPEHGMPFPGWSRLKATWTTHYTKKSAERYGPRCGFCIWAFTSDRTGAMVPRNGRLASSHLQGFVTMFQPQTIGLALGSGGARGLAHAGVLEALKRPASGPTWWPAPAWAPSWAASTPRTRTRPRSGDAWKPTWTTRISPPTGPLSCPASEDRGQGSPEPPVRHLRLHAAQDDRRQDRDPAATCRTRSKLRGPLAELFGPVGFEDLAIPLAAVALDLISGQSVVYTNGPVVDGIYASSAIPSVFPPVEQRRQDDLRRRRPLPRAGRSLPRPGRRLRHRRGHPRLRGDQFFHRPGHDPAQQHHRPPAPEPLRLRHGRFRHPARR